MDYAADSCGNSDHHIASLFLVRIIIFDAAMVDDKENRKRKDMI
jgi:hypothetical protein